MRIKKYAAAFLAATTVLGSLAACGPKETSGDVTNTPTPGNNEPGQPEGTTTPTPTEVPARDLGGFEVIIGDHWSPETPEPPKNAQEEATLAYRESIQKKYNFKVTQKAVAGWGDMTDTCTNSILAGDPVAQIFILDQGFVAKPMSNGLFYDLATLDELDFTEDKWNDSLIELMTKGDSIYGMASGRPEARGGLFWNKRMFEEAGIDPELPYELQASGEWTWSKFKDICGKLTRDTNGDGVTDVYAMANFGPDICKQFISSTGAQVVNYNKETEKYENNSQSQEVLDALNFLKELGDAGYEMPAPAEAQWDWFKQAFADGWFAMQFNETYMGGQMWKDMEDDFGFVCCPKPDGYEGGYHTYYNDNVVIIPSCYDAETASKIAFVYNLWANPTPGYEEDDDWKSIYYPKMRDERSVDDTIAMFYEDGVALTLNMALIYGLDTGALFYTYPFQTMTPAEKIEEIQNSWNTAINEANK